MDTNEEAIHAIREWMAAHEAHCSRHGQDIADLQSRVGTVESIVQKHVVRCDERGEHQVEVIERIEEKVDNNSDELQAARTFRQSLKGGWLAISVVGIVITNLLTLVIAIVALLLGGQ